jgi:hypothetical protein
VQSNAVQWNRAFEYEVVLKFVDGVAQSCPERICVRMETDGGRAYAKVWYGGWIGIDGGPWL